MDWMKAGNTAVITGAAGGIGYEAARRYAAAGLNVVMADIKDELNDAADTIRKTAAKGASVLAHQCDVSDMAAVEALRDTAQNAFGDIHCLMNNAGIARRGTLPWEDLAAFHEIININLMGVVHGCHAFIPAMLAHGKSGAIINTSSKQGITRPPGNYAYNLSKTGVLGYTESIAHAFRGIDSCALNAHLLVPGFVYTPMISGFVPTQPPGATTAEATVDFMLASLKADDFYIICPDGETDRTTDEKRIQWTADDIIKNRPALSRWHPDYEADFAAFMEGE